MPFPLILNMSWEKSIAESLYKNICLCRINKYRYFTFCSRVNQATVVGILSSPINKSCLNNSIINNPVILDLFWKKDFNAVRYQLEVATDSIFNNLFYNDSYITDTTITLVGFNYSTIYYWRVRAFDFNNNSNISSTWNFTTQDTRN